MSPELIAIIAAAIALGTAVLALIRGVRQEVRDLRGEMTALETRLRDEMQAGFKELTTRIANLGDRLSKVEGIIQGMFWGARNQAPDKPGEGAA